MSVNGIGGTANFPGFSERQLQAVKQFFGVNKDDIEDVQKEFKKAGLDSPEGINKLADSFKEYDLNKDDTLSVSEIVNFQKIEKTALGTKGMSLVGAGDGISADQLEVMSKLSRKFGDRNKPLETLQKKFDRYDKDNDGLISSDEYDKFAKRQDLSTADRRDKQALENALTARVISAYEQNQESSTNFVVSLFVSEA